MSAVLIFFKYTVWETGTVPVMKLKGGVVPTDLEKKLSTMIKTI
jgi:hypothetical protein